MNRTTFDEVIIKNEIRYDLCGRDRWQGCFKKDINRGSTASLTRAISADSWSMDLSRAYQHALELHGWKSISAGSNAWQACKSDVLATLDQKTRLFPALGINTFGIRFEYNAATIHECENVH